MLSQLLTKAGPFFLPMFAIATAAVPLLMLWLEARDERKVRPKPPKPPRKPRRRPKRTGNEDA